VLVIKLFSDKQGLQFYEPIRSFRQSILCEKNTFLVFLSFRFTFNIIAIYNVNVFLFYFIQLCYDRLTGRVISLSD